MAFGKRRKLEDDNATIDMTPMLDVVFILLIFFVVTASFVHESGFAINTPAVSEKTTTVTSKKSLITLLVDNDSRVWLDGKEIDIRAVRAHIESYRVENPAVKLLVKAQPSATTATFVLISDQAQQAGLAVDNIALSASASRS